MFQIPLLDTLEKLLKFLGNSPAISQRQVFYIPSSKNKSHRLKICSTVSLLEKYQWVYDETRRESTTKIDWSNSLRVAPRDEKVGRDIFTLPPICTIIFRNRAPTCKFESRVIPAIAQPASECIGVYHVRSNHLWLSTMRLQRRLTWRAGGKSYRWTSWI